MQRIYQINSNYNYFPKFLVTNTGIYSFYIIDSEHILICEAWNQLNDMIPFEAYCKHPTLFG